MWRWIRVEIELESGAFPSIEHILMTVSQYVNIRKPLIVTRLREKTFSSRCCDLVACQMSTAAASSESTTFVSHFFFSTPSTHLLDRISIDVQTGPSQCLHSLLVASQCLIPILQRLPHILCVSLMLSCAW